jgi:hypothetical protein
MNATIPQQITRVIQVLFNVPSGYTYLEQFLDECKISGISDFSNNFVNTYFSNYTNYELAEKVSSNLLFANDNLKNICTSYLTNQFDLRTDRGAVILESLNLLSSLGSNSLFWETANLFNAAVESSLSYSVSPDNTSTDLVILMGASDINYNNVSATITGDDYSNTSASIGSIILDTFDSGSISGSINFKNDKDWFAVDMVAGKTYILTASPPVGSSSSLIDLMIDGINAPDGKLIQNTFNDNYGNNSNPRLIFVPTITGKHFISIAENGSELGEYTLYVNENSFLSLGSDTPADITTTVTLTVDAKVTDVVEEAYDVDWIRFEALNSETYIIDLLGKDSDHGTLANPYLRGIFDSSGSYVNNTFDNDSGFGKNAQVTFSPEESGIYFIAAAANSFGIGDYILSVSKKENMVPEQEVVDVATDSTSTTVTLSVAESITGAIDFGDDKDWIKTSLVAGSQYTFNLLGSATNSGTLNDPYIWGLYDQNGNVITKTSDDDGGFGFNSQLIYTASSTGDHYISAGSINSDVGSYTLELLGEQGLSDTSDTIDTLATIKAGASIIDNIDFSSDNDWFSTSLVEGYQYTFQLEGSSTNAGSLIDPYLIGLYDSAGSYIADTSNDDGGVEYNSRLIYTAPRTDTYFISAGAYGASGSYTLNLSAGVIPTNNDIPDNVSTTSSITVGGSVIGNIDDSSDWSGDQDWFKVSLIEGYQYIFILEGSSTNAGTLDDPTIIGLNDANSVYIDGTYDDDSGAGYNSELIYVADTTGIYYVVIGAYDGTGTYSLSFSGEQLSSGAVSDLDILNTLETTAKLSASEPVTGTIEIIDDTDWFNVTLIAGNQYTFDLEGESTTGGTLADPYLIGLYDVNGSYVTNTNDDDSGIGLNSQYIYTPTISGDYYISAGAFDSTGTYTLKMAEIDNSIQVDDSIDATDTNTSKWNIMIYLAADNDLEQMALEDMHEMELAIVTEDINVSVLVDRAPGYSENDGDWTDTRRGLITSDNTSDNISTILQSLGELNTGDPNTLTDFINWSVSNKPSENYALIIWNHGGGIWGSAWDESNGNDNLSLNDVTTAIKNSTLEKFDVIGYDACQMGMFNALYPLEDYTEYYVASSENEWGYGWDYTNLINSITSNLEQDAQSLASIIVETYSDSFSQVSWHNEYTLSSINMSYLNSLAQKLNNFSSIVQNNATNSDWDAIKAAHEATAIYAGQKDYLDFGDFFKNIIESNSQDVIINASTDVSNAYSWLIDYSKGNVTDYTGMSIYLPGPGANDNGGYLQDFEELLPWRNFVSELTQVGVDKQDTAWWS